MQALFRTILLGTALAVGCAATASAADAADPLIATWTLNLEKSKFTPGPGSRSRNRTYLQSAQGVILTVTGVAADGSAISQQSTFNCDGKDYAFAGSPDHDAISLKKVNGSTVKSEIKLEGAVVGATMRSISDHGKVLTLKTKAKTANGADFEAVAVFDKQ